GRRLRRGAVRRRGGRHEPGAAPAGAGRRPAGVRDHLRAEAAGPFGPRSSRPPGPPWPPRAEGGAEARGGGHLVRGAATRPGVRRYAFVWRAGRPGFTMTPLRLWFPGGFLMERHVAGILALALLAGVGKAADANVWVKLDKA